MLEVQHAGISSTACTMSEAIDLGVLVSQSSALLAIPVHGKLAMNALSQN
jgi:hypothetical protein